MNNTLNLSHLSFRKGQYFCFLMYLNTISVTKEPGFVSPSY